MYNNMYANNMYQQGMGGMQYAQMPQAKMVQPLTEEQMKQLQNNNTAFNLQVPEIEFIASACTHKKNGQIVLMPNGDGTATCPICHKTFNLLDIDPVEVQQITANIIDVLQSIKTYFVDMPESYAVEYFRMLPLLEKLPEFYKLAIANFRRYEAGSPLQQQNNNMYSFGMLNAITNPGVGMPGAGMMNYAPQQQMMGGYNEQQAMMMQQQIQQQQMMGGMGYPQQQQMGNAFGNYGGQQQQYTPGNIQQNVGVQTSPAPAPSAGQTPQQNNNGVQVTSKMQS